MSATSQLLTFDRRPSEPLGILPQFPISLGRKIVYIVVIVMEDPLDFNMILGHNYVYDKERK